MLLMILVCLAIISVVYGTLTNWSTPQTNIVGAIVKPVQKFSKGVSDGFDDFFKKFKKSETYEAEQKQLQSQINKLTSDLLDYQEIKQQNEFYKGFFEIKQKNPDFKMLPSTLIARDPTDPYGTFTLDKGIVDGVAVYDPVITAEGLVGYISDAQSTQSVVTTVLNPKLNVSAIDRRTRDAGNITGTPELAAKGKCKLAYLPRSNSAAENDYIVSSGAGGVFPEGLLIGNIEEIKQDTQNISFYAVVVPVVKFDEIRDVMVITSFNGQSSIADKKAGK